MHFIITTIYIDYINMTKINTNLHLSIGTAVAYSNSFDPFANKELPILTRLGLIDTKCFRLNSFNVCDVYNLSKNFHNLLHQQL